MINAQTQLLKAGGSVLALAGAASKISSDLKEAKEKEEKIKKAGIDAKMAAKARKTVQQKIKNIQANKDISDKARTRRIGVVIKEYTNEITGGNK